MRKTTAFFWCMAMLLGLTACTPHPATIDSVPNINSTPYSTNLHLPTTTQPTSTPTQPTPPVIQPILPENPIYDPSVPLFIGGTYEDEMLHYVNAYGVILHRVSDLLPYYAENGLAAAYSPATQKYGYVDRQGVFIIEPIYEQVGPFSPIGLAPVGLLTENGEEKFGYINAQGEIVIPCEYDAVSPFSQYGYAEVHKNNRNGEAEIGVIDSSGSICLPFAADHRITLKKDCIILDYLDADYMFVRSELRDYNGNIIDSIDYISDYYHGRVKYDFCSDGSVFKIEAVYNDNGDFYTYKLHHLENGVLKPYETPIDSTIQSDRKQVSTTQTGYGYKLTFNGVDLSGYEYDLVTQSCPNSRYLFAFTYADENLTAILADIYDLYTGKKTADDIAFQSFSCILGFQQDRYLPDGYFTTCEYRSGVEYYGIIDYTGKYILEPIYEGVAPYSYDAIMQEFLY